MAVLSPRAGLSPKAGVSSKHGVSPKAGLHSWSTLIIEATCCLDSHTNAADACNSSPVAISVKQAKQC